MPTPPQLTKGRWTDTVHDTLLGLLELKPRSAPRIAAFDWDETCMRGDISYAMLDDLEARTGDELWAHYRGLIARDRLLAYKELATLLLAGRTATEVADWTRAVADECQRAGKMARVPEIEALVGALVHAGWDVWVVTGSPTEVVAALAPTYGIDPEQVVGMDAVVGPDGRFEARLIEPVTWREGKPEQLRRRTGRPLDFAIGDSEGDIQLLKSATTAVWIDRGDPELKAAALTHGWLRQEAWT